MKLPDLPELSLALEMQSKLALRSGASASCSTETPALVRMSRKTPGLWSTSSTPANSTYRGKQRVYGRLVHTATATDDLRRQQATQGVLPQLSVPCFPRHQGEVRNQSSPVLSRDAEGRGGKQAIASSAAQTLRGEKRSLGQNTFFGLDRDRALE